MTPASAPRRRIAKASTGVGNGRGNTIARPPAATTTAAVSAAKTSELCLASSPMTTKGCGSVSFRYAVSPAAARITTERFIRLGPAPSAPRSPAVPNSSMPTNRSARSAPASASPAAAAAITASSSARVAASGSSSRQEVARSSSSRGATYAGGVACVFGAAAVASAITPGSRSSRRWPRAGDRNARGHRREDRDPGVIADATAAAPKTQATPPAYVAPLELLERATSWRDDDPDAATRAELDAVIAAAAAGDAEAGADLADRFVGMLEFGTAGLRGALGAGPNRMNRSVVIRAAAGLTAYLKETEPHPLVVIGLDARHNSDVFAADTAAVVVAAGGRAMVLPRPLPTPVLAFAIRHLGADAGVMVTASHNPAQDNGYKVYLGDGSQIVPPSDADIAAHIAEVRHVADVPRASSGWTTLNDDLLEAYLDAAAAVVAPGGARDLRVVHTALHGVGSAVIVAAFARAGFSAPIVVPSQSQPDPDFPTVVFPNPEEPGAIDAALALAARERADLVLANDPDADRCAVAVPD